jgi:hypothetical protein
LRVEAVGFTKLRYFFPQLGDAFFDWILHRDRLAEHIASSGRKARFQSLNGAASANSQVVASECSGRKRRSKESSWSPESGMVHPPSKSDEYLLLRALYSVRSEPMLMERPDYNL